MVTGAFSLDAAPARFAPARVGRPWTGTEVAAAAINLLLAVAVVAYFHDRFWWPADDGAYAYVADQLRHGAVLNRDIHDVHGGYVHFLHAWAFDLFGRDLVSLRYPLAALTVLQSVIVFALLRAIAGPAALAGGLAMSALTFVQYLNPTANWYALFLAVVVAALLAANLQRTLWGLVLIGAMLALTLCFRQLTGIFVAMAAVTWLLVSDRPERPGAAILARGIIAIMAAGLAGYLFLKADAASLALYGIGPLALLAAAAYCTGTSDRRVTTIAGGLALGAALGILPLVLYNVAHGSLGVWWHDITVGAVALTDIDFFDRASYALLATMAGVNIVGSGSPAAVLNGVFWLVVLLAPLILAIAAVRELLAGKTPHPLVVVAVFYGLVAAHYAIPLYASYPAGIVLAGWVAVAEGPRTRIAALATIVFACAVGLVFQAGQPLSRDYAGIVRGDRVALDSDGLPGASVKMESADAAMYGRFLAFIDAHAAPGATILGLPMTPQLYFLSARKPPVRWIIAPLGLLRPEDVDDAWRAIAADPPAVVVFRPDDKYTTPLVRDLMDRLRPQLTLCASEAGFELYVAECGA